MTIDQLIEEIKSKPFSITVNNKKVNCRFLKDDEVVTVKDYQFSVQGFGFREYSSPIEMEKLMSNLDIGKKQKNEKKVKDFLLANPQYYKKGRKAWVIAAVSHDNYGGEISPTNCADGLVKDFPSFCFIRFL